MSDTVKIGNLVVYNQGGIWIVRDFKTRKELAHEPTKADALIVAKRINKNSAA